MATIPGLTEETIRVHTADGSFERGERYLANGAVLQVKVHEKKLEAPVQGSAPMPYTVSVWYGESGIERVRCTCPYHEGSWCKHIVAALLAHLRQDAAAREGAPAQEEQEASLDALLEEMNRAELVSLVRRLAGRDPRVAAWVSEETNGGSAS